METFDLYWKLTVYFELLDINSRTENKLEEIRSCFNQDIKVCISRQHTSTKIWFIGLGTPVIE